LVVHPAVARERGKRKAALTRYPTGRAPISLDIKIHDAVRHREAGSPRSVEVAPPDA
jgi:hypothetical protein